MLPVETEKDTFQVWTKRVGNNTAIKVLLLHGGPGLTHEYLEAFDSYFPAANIEYYYYDQLGSAYSDQPEAAELWNLPRFVEEVEEVRQALGLDRENFYLYGHSFGGVLAIEYALKYQQHLKGLVISNMVASTSIYNEYMKSVILPGMDPAVRAEIEQYEASGNFDDPRYPELLGNYYYTEHFLRLPAAQWPEPVNRSLRHANAAVYRPLLGPSDLLATGALAHWDRTADLERIAVPTLVIGARYDTMSPEQMQSMAGAVQHGRYLFCPAGSHMALYDDQEVYFAGLIDFIRDVDSGRF
jgi:proline iminopeptidase